MRGLWLDPISGHLERIEQCGIRIIVTSEGVIHDCFLANGRQEDGVDDVAGCAPINPAGLFQPEQRRFTLYPNGVPADNSTAGPVVIRQLTGDDELQWIHPLVGVTNMTRLVGSQVAGDGIYYGSPPEGKLSTYFPRIQTPGCSYGEDPSVEDLKAHPNMVPLMLQVRLGMGRGSRPKRHDRQALSVVCWAHSPPRVLYGSGACCTYTPYSSPKVYTSRVCLPFAAATTARCCIMY